MITLSKVVGFLAKAVAWVWVGLLLLGNFGKLFMYINRQGFAAGFGAWRDWLDPFNPLTMLVHLVELLPAIALFVLAKWLEQWRERRRAQISN